MSVQSDEQALKVWVIVLLYNGKKWADQCLGSILNSDYPSFETLVVDNGSSDDGCDYIRQNMPQVKVIDNGKNYGTAEGLNKGIRYALAHGAEYLVLLNQDLKVERNWLAELMRIAQKTPDVGVLSPLQYSYNETDIERAFRDILKKTDYFEDVRQGQAKELYRTDFVIGASLLVKRAVFETIGLFDPLYFMYNDDNDFCRRAVYRGIGIGIVPASRIYHYHGLVHDRGQAEVMKVTRTFKARLLYLFKRNYLLFRLKDPNRSFAHNIKVVFFWVKWRKLFEEIHAPAWAMAKAFCFLIVAMPLIYIKYRSEKSRACYLQHSI